MTDKGEKMKSKNSSAPIIASKNNNKNSPQYQYRENSSARSICRKCGGTGTYLDPNGRTAGDCPICRPNMVDGDLREKIAEWLHKWFQGGCHWTDLSDGQRERYRKDADSILDLTASYWKGEIARLKADVARLQRSYDTAQAFIDEGTAKLQASHKAEVERVFKKMINENRFMSDESKALLEEFVQALKASVEVNYERE